MIHDEGTIVCGLVWFCCRWTLGITIGAGKKVYLLALSVFVSGSRGNLGPMLSRLEQISGNVGRAQHWHTDTLTSGDIRGDQSFQHRLLPSSQPSLSLIPTTRIHEKIYAAGTIIIRVWIQNNCSVIFLLQVKDTELLSLPLPCIAGQWAGWAGENTPFWVAPLLSLQWKHFCNNNYAKIVIFTA